MMRGRRRSGGEGGLRRCMLMVPPCRGSCCNISIGSIDACRPCRASTGEAWSGYSSSIGAVTLTSIARAGQRSDCTPARTRRRTASGLWKGNALPFLHDCLEGSRGR